MKNCLVGVSSSMGNKIFDALESCFNIFGIAIGVSDIESWLGVCLLVINILAILIRSGLKVYDHIKHGKIDDAYKEIDKARDDINNIDKK